MTVITFILPVKTFLAQPEGKQEKLDRTGSFSNFKEDPGTSILSISGSWLETCFLSGWDYRMLLLSFPEAPLKHLSGIPQAPNKARSLRCKLIETDSFP